MIKKCEYLLDTIKITGEELSDLLIIILDNQCESVNLLIN